MRIITKMITILKYLNIYVEHVGPLTYVDLNP